MFTVNSKHVSWEEEAENWDTECPVCEGTGMMKDTIATWEDADEDDRIEACESLGIPTELAQSESVPQEVINLHPDDIEAHFVDVSEIECTDCSGSGFLELYWNTVWEIGKQVTDQQRRQVQEAGCIVVTDQHGEAWLTLGGCGMDMTPYMCHAWLELGFTWLPLEWISSVVGNSSYIESCKNPETAQRIRKAIDYTLDMAVHRIADMRKMNSQYYTEEGEADGTEASVEG